MEQIIIHRGNTTIPIADRRTATGIKSAKQNWALSGEETVEITVESPFSQTYQIGDKIEVFGRVYKLNRLPKVKRTGMHEFQYDLEFEGVQYDLMRATYDVNISTTDNALQDISGDAYTGTIKDFMRILIANANRVFPGAWVLGDCPDTDVETRTFGESDNCLSVLQTLCNDNDVQFEITHASGVFTINIKKVGQILPDVFKFGKGRGLYSLTRDNVSSSNIITRLKVRGSSENITTKYRSDRLLLPDKTKSQSYLEDADAIAKYGIYEAAKIFDIKPTFTGKVTSITSLVEFVDTSIPFDLNAKDADGNILYLLNGQAATIHFNTGNLAGYEFEVSKYDHATKTFRIKKFTDSRDTTFPSEKSAAFQIKVGDEYKILGIALPESIISAAESKLLEEATKYFNQNKQPKVQYSLSVTKAYLEKVYGSNAGIVNVFTPGDYLQIQDDEIGVDKAVRIKSFTRNLLDEYDYKLTISDTVKANIITRVISELTDIEKVIQVNDLQNPARAKANWRTSRELLDMVFDAEGDYYTEKIKPLSIDTQLLSVGAKSMQFGLTNTVFQPNFNGNANSMRWQGGVLTHYTIIEDGVRSWAMADGSVTFSQNVPYYLYAKCPKADGATDGTFLFSTEQIKVEDDANYWHFLIGTVSSIEPDLGVRSLSLTYGFTMVNGRFIKTGRIESAGGTTYFDLDKGEIGGKINFLDGLVSGDIGVGNEKGINAGLSGVGNNEKDVRFFAGSTKSNKKNAPFRVLQDGTVVMTKATVEGIINAISGYIGGFKISQGQIGSGTQDEQDTANGLCLTNGFIRFRNANQRVLLGCLSSLGYPFNGLMELTGDFGTTLEIYRKLGRTDADGSLETMFKPCALFVSGNQWSVGKVAHFENGYVGEAYTNIIESMFMLTHKYHFTTCNSGYRGINLPTKTNIDKATDNVPVIFDIEVVCDRAMPNRLCLTSQTGAQLYNSNGDAMDKWDMERGDSCTLRYYNGGYMFVNSEN